MKPETRMTTHANADISMTNASPVEDVEEQSRRVSRWVSILYLVAALATPLLLYFGPDVLSPTAPAIADAALDGRLTMHPAPACTAKSAASAVATARC
jgi:hypothetical protein